MNQKLYPKVIRLKKNVMVIAIMVIALIIALLVWNIFQSVDSSKTIKETKLENTHVSTSANNSNWHIANKAQQAVKPSEVTLGLTNNFPAKKEHKSIDKKIYAPKKTYAKEQNETYLAEMAAPISSNMLTAEHIESSKSNNSQLNKNEKLASFKSGVDNDEILLSPLRKPLSPFALMAGSQIPCELITEINSDLQGYITGQVRETIYDTVSGNYLLIPQGTKVFGAYKSEVIYGQSRVLVSWERLLFPNGASLNLKGMPGTDLKGASGFGDEVDNHLAKIFGSVILGSVMSAGAQLSQPQQSTMNPYQSPSVNQTMAQSLGTNIANTVVAMTNKNLDIAPTITIRQGYLFNIQVTKDLIFSNLYED